MDWDRLEEGWVGMSHSCMLQALPVPPGATCLWPGPPLRPSSPPASLQLVRAAMVHGCPQPPAQIKFPTQ